MTYSINRRQSDRDGVFRIDSSTGLLVLDKRLDYDRKQVSHQEVSKFLLVIP